MTHLGSHAVEWTAALPDHSIQNVCSGDILTLPWSYTTTPGDSILSVKWYFKGASEQLIAIYSPPHFAPMSAYSKRVQMASDAGIALSEVTTADTGIYYVTVSGHDSSGAVFAYKHSVAVKVIGNETKITTDGELHAQFERRAILSNTTDRWSLVLSCGNFTYLSDPPFNMEWETPCGKVVPSDDYIDGHFQLFVTSGGEYTCRMPLQDAVDVCNHNVSSLRATVKLGLMEARVTLLEAKQEQLLEENQQLSLEKEQLMSKDSMLEAADTRLAWSVQDLTMITDQLKSQVTELDDQQSQLTSNDTDLTQSLQALTKKVNHQVAFSARLSARHTGGGTIIFKEVLTNYGDGYSPLTGNFTAPVTGLYFFILTSSPDDKDTFPHAQVLTEGSDVCDVNSPIRGDMATCGGAEHLNVGETVWATSKKRLRSGITSFSGFLIKSD